MARVEEEIVITRTERGNVLVATNHGYGEREVLVEELRRVLSGQGSVESVRMVVEYRS